VTRLGEFSPNGRLFTLGTVMNPKRSPNFCATFSRSVDYALILPKIGLGYILGVFFTNSSGHPEGLPQDCGFKSLLNYNFDPRKKAFNIHMYINMSVVSPWQSGLVTYVNIVSI
jgi:hypothetical protein